MNHAEDSAQIGQRATSSVKWSALSEAVSRTAAPIVAVILARILTPTDFGILATAMVVISFAQMFWDAGLGKALIQTSEAPEAAADIVFWTNLGLGVLVYAAIYATAPRAAVFFRSPESEPVLRVLGLQVVLASLISVQQALFVRQLNFRILFWMRLLSALVAPVFSIPLALRGFGVWALVAGVLAGQLVSLVLVWRTSRWRPRRRYPLALARKLSSFGLWVVAESLGGWLIMWGDGLLVGRFLGVHDLGLYRTGWMLVTIVFGIVLNPLLPVLYPTFSRLQNDVPSLMAHFHGANRFIIALALPMGTGLLFLGPEVAEVLFGAGWEGLSLVLSVIGLGYASSWLVGINPEMYRALGRPDVNTKLSVGLLLYYVPAYLIAAQSSLETFLYVRCGVAVLSIPIHVIVYRRILGGSPYYLWTDGKPFILGASAMGISLALAKWCFHRTAPALPDAAGLAALITMGALVYAITVWLLDRKFVALSARLLRRAALA